MEWCLLSNHLNLLYQIDRWNGIKNNTNFSFFYKKSIFPLFPSRCRRHTGESELINATLIRRSSSMAEPRKQEEHFDVLTKTGEKTGFSKSRYDLIYYAYSSFFSSHTGSFASPVILDRKTADWSSLVFKLSSISTTTGGQWWLLTFWLSY